MQYFWLLSGLYMGWSLGVNDPSHIFGTAYITNMLKWKTIAILLCVFIIVGALLQGKAGLENLGSLAKQTNLSAFISAFVAATTVLIMAGKFSLPASTSQAMLGAIIGIAVVNDGSSFTMPPKVWSMMLSWILTPGGCIILTFILYPLFAKIFNKMGIADKNGEMNTEADRAHQKRYNTILNVGVILAGCYGSYALGANNLANVTGVYYGTLLNANGAIWLGALSICLGVLTYGKQITDKVMKTVGKELVELTKFGSFLAVISMAIVMQIYAVVGIPVSSAMALVGGTLAIGIYRKQINRTSIKALRRTILGWIFTPIMGFVLSYGIYFVLKNFFHFS
ncbi:MAG: anion permease [Spirochaetia bacterium]|nr:anion permease [Spirochaetia bacterium]